MSKRPRIKVSGISDLDALVAKIISEQSSPDQFLRGLADVNCRCGSSILLEDDDDMVLEGEEALEGSVRHLIVKCPSCYTEFYADFHNDILIRFEEEDLTDKIDYHPEDSGGTSGKYLKARKQRHQV
jgi:hypothetical protein